MSWRHRVFVCGVFGGLLGCIDYHIDAAAGTGQPVPGGELFPIDVSGDADLGGIAVTLSALPATISVSPATVTLDSNGDAVAQALVPYGVSGSVIVAGAFTNTTPVRVDAEPLTLCPIAFTATSNQSSDGQVYATKVHVVHGQCSDGTNAPAGVPVAFSVTQAGASAAVSTVVVDGNGDAELPVLVPWGKPVVVVATGGGASVTGTQFGEANPATVSCLTWTVTGNVYSVTAQVMGLPLASVTFSITPSDGGVVSPTTVNTMGTASTSVTVADPAKLPVVQAVSGNSSLAETLTSTAKSTCP